jgi:hypothetical protein
MPDRDAALRKIAAIARDAGLTADDVHAALSADAADDEKENGRSNVLGRLLAILGGVFVFSGLVVFIGMNWEAMNSAARVIVTLGSGLAALVLAIIAASDKRFARVQSPLLVVSAVLQPTGILVALHEYGSGGDERIALLIACAVMLVQQGVLFLRFRTTLLAFLTIAFSCGVITVTMDLLDADGEVIATLIGAYLVLLSAGLQDTQHRAMTPFWYFVGSASLLIGLFELVRGTVVELAFLAVASAGVWLSTWARSRALLVVCTIAILCYLSYVTHKHFLNSLGWPLFLILVGVMLIGGSIIAMRLNRRYISA